MKMFIISLSLLLVVSLSATAQTLLVSDVDDTIKLANVPSTLGKVKYAADTESRFAGMAELYTLLKRDIADLSIVYLTKAPAWLMEKNHKKFLKNGKFPHGVYAPRDEFPADKHKLLTLRRLMESYRPKKVLFFGDNGEQDPQVYDQIRREYEPQGVEFISFIRLITPARVYAEQMKFVTPVEVSLQLKSYNLLSSASYSWVMEKLAPYIVAQKVNLTRGTVAFPDYVKCETFSWDWEVSNEFPVLLTLKDKIIKQCN